MSFFKVTKSEEATAEFTGGGTSSYISNSGMYPVNVIVPFVNAGREKASTIDLFVEYEEQKQVIYGNMSYTNRDGRANKIGQEVFNKLVILSGVDEIADPVDADLPIGKKGTSKSCAVLEDLADIECIMQIRMEYGMWNNNITEKTVIKSFFRASDKASIEEIVAEEAGKEVVFGTQYAALEESANFVTYSDGTTEESIAEWIKAKRPKGTGSTAPAAPKPSFGNKAKFGAK